MPGVFCHLLFLYFDFPFSVLTFSCTLSTLYKFWAEVGAIQKFLLFFHTFQCSFPGQRINLREQSLIHSLISASIMTADSLLNLYQANKQLISGLFYCPACPSGYFSIAHLRRTWPTSSKPASLWGRSLPDFFLPTSSSSPALHKKTMSNSTDSTLAKTD